MKFSAVIVTLAFGSAAAFAPQQGSAPMRTTELSAKRGGRNAKKASLSAKDELMALAELGATYPSFSFYRLHVTRPACGGGGQRRLAVTATVAAVAAVPPATYGRSSPPSFWVEPDFTSATRARDPVAPPS